MDEGGPGSCIVARCFYMHSRHALYYKTKIILDGLRTVIQQGISKINIRIDAKLLVRLEGKPTYSGLQTRGVCVVLALYVKRLTT